jgi:hypothetical protein
MPQNTLRPRLFEKFQKALFSSARVCRQHRSGLFSYHTQPPFSLRQTNTYRASCPHPHKTALLAGKAIPRTLEICFQSGIFSVYDLADGASADSAFLTKAENHTSQNHPASAVFVRQARFNATNLKAIRLIGRVTFTKCK